MPRGNGIDIHFVIGGRAVTPDNTISQLRLT
jgi:hypothetical protein